MSQSPDVEKVLVIGGGMGALTAVYELTASGKPYDITVYQLGWRLGGKGASGRNAQHHQRIEEHGLHMWSGLYDNAFHVIRDCYAAWQRPAAQPLSTWQKAFTPRNTVVLEETYADKTYLWPLVLPQTERLPGEANAPLFLTLAEYVAIGCQFILSNAPAARAAGWRGWLQASWFQAGLTALAHGAAAGVKRLGRRGLQVLFDQGHKLLHWVWQQARSRLADTAIRRLWLTLNFAWGNLRGCFAEDLPAAGFDRINQHDYRDWLKTYLIDDGGLTLNSPLAWFLYDANFAYRQGDPQQPDLAAGVALYTLIRMAFTWKGALLWDMQAGMGDVVFAPLYEVLRQRGVKFKFFHRAQHLRLTPQGEAVAAVVMARQVRLKPEHEADGYQPLVMVGDLPCWPSAPRYEQIEDGAQYASAQVDFEDWATPSVEEFTLKAGRDFDHLILGTSLAPLKHIAQELAAASPQWQAMLTHVLTVPTQAVQLWLNQTTETLSAVEAQAILNVCRASPLNVGAYMNHLITREGWPAEGPLCPRSITYLCGILPDAPDPHPALAQLQASANACAVDHVQTLLKQHIPALWPQATSPTGFPAAWWVGATPATAQAQGCFVKANVQPSERYVLSVKGSIQHRLWPGRSGFANVYLAGDWTQTGFNLGNIESTVISGRLAAHAVCGAPPLEAIVGLDFGYPRPPQAAH